MELDFEIDKITNSIEDAKTGEVLKTIVLPIGEADLEDITTKNNWLFDWKLEFSKPERQLFKIVSEKEPNIIQGLLSLRKDIGFVFMHLIESAPFNRGKNKKYLGIAGNLTAFGCKLSFEYGFDGYIAFDSKTQLVDHYIETLGAVRLFGNRLAIHEERARFLVDHYFPETEELS